MADTQKPDKSKAVPVKPGPVIKTKRHPEEDFCTHEDFKLHTMACDQIDAGENLEFYLKPMNTGWAMLPNGGRKQFFMKRG